MPADASPASASSPAAAAPTRRERRRAERAAQIEAELSAGSAESSAIPAQPTLPATSSETAPQTARSANSGRSALSANSASSATSPITPSASGGPTAGGGPETSETTRAATVASAAPTGRELAGRDRANQTPAPESQAARYAGAEHSGNGTPATSPAAKPVSRAGRNLPAAIGVGLGLGALLLASLFIVKQAFVVLAIIGCLGALWELDKAVRSRSIKLPLLPLAVGTVGMLVSAYSAGIEALLVAFVLTAGGVFIWRVVDGGGAVALREATAGIFAAGYIPFLAGFLTIMLSKDDGSIRVLMLIALVVANDTGGYTAGVLFGRHPMAPSVSPKKSWEGAAGSLVLAAGVGAGFAHWGLQLQWWVGLVLAVGAVAGAIVGDLAESLLKRDLGIKDMGNLLPGHGGVLDRIDSILLATPVVFALMLVVAPA